MIRYSIGYFICMLMLLAACGGKKYTEKDARRTKSQGIGAKYKLGVQVQKMDKSIWSVFEDRKGHYWFGSNGNGLYHYDDTVLLNIKEDLGIVDNSIRGIQEDIHGNVYIQTPEGVSKYDGEKFTTLPIVESPKNEWKLTADDLWFNCNGNANEVYRYEGDTLYELALPRQELEKAFGGEVEGLGFPGMNSSPYSVFGIDKDKDGNLWIGTAVAGAFRYDGESFLWFGEKELTTLPDGRVPGVRSMIQDRKGYFWLSNFISKYRIKEEDGTPTYEKLKGMDSTYDNIIGDLPYFNSSVTDDDENIWITSYSGDIWKYDGVSFTYSQVKEGDTELLVVSIYKDNEGVLWLATDNLGVYRYNGFAFEKFEDWKK